MICLSSYQTTLQVCCTKTPRTVYEHLCINNFSVLWKRRCLLFHWRRSSARQGMVMLVSHLLGLNQCFENNLFEDAKKLFSQLMCDLKTIPISHRKQDENMKVTKSLFTLESGLSKLMIRAYCLDNFEQVRLSNSYKFSS